MAVPVPGSARSTTGAVARSTLVLCVLATAGIVLVQELRTPLHLPGHRGLIWLGLLVAVRLVAARPGPALAAGVASAGLVAGLGLAPGPLRGCGRAERGTVAGPSPRAPAVRAGEYGDQLRRTCGVDVVDVDE